MLITMVTNLLKLQATMIDTIRPHSVTARIIAIIHGANVESDNLGVTIKKLPV